MEVCTWNLQKRLDVLRCTGHGEAVAYVTFPLAEPKVAEINHTFVSDELRGQGVAAKLLAGRGGHDPRRGLESKADLFLCGQLV